MSNSLPNSALNEVEFTSGPSKNKPLGQRRSVEDVANEVQSIQIGQKRKRQDSELPPSKRPAVPRLFWQIRNEVMETILRLLNQDIDDIVKKRTYPISHMLSSQVGLTEWTSQEKESLFNTLALGRDNLPLIAESVGKSIPQVQEYILLLDNAVSEFTAAYGPPLPVSKVPAAVEVPPAMETILTLGSELMQLHMQRLEEVKDDNRFGDIWLLDQTIADQVEDEYKDLQPPRILTMIPSVDLLHLPNMLRLSHRLYMTEEMHGISDWYGSGFATDRGPSVRRVAFDDLHSLVVSMLRRLVSTVLYQANDRIRTRQDQSDAVTSVDVENAIDILGLAHNSFEYWIKLPRRLDLSVRRSSRPMAFEKFLPAGLVSYDQAEEALASKHRINPGKYRKYLATRPSRVLDSVNEMDFDFDSDSESDSASVMDTSSLDNSGESSNSDVDSDSDSDSDPDSDADSNTESSDSSESESKSESESESNDVEEEKMLVDNQDELETTELEKLDQKASQAMVKELCSSLGLDQEFTPVKPNLQLLQRGLDTAGSWRDDIDFRGLWEEKYIQELNQ
jgi:RNA polymerase I-specific transcription initiation factor RRN5